MADRELPKPEHDGVSHINIYSKANTPLGRFLSNFNGPPVDTEDGRFATVEGYWQWLRTPERWPDRDAFRDAGGYEAKKLSKRVKDAYDDRPGVDTAFKRKIARVILQKIITAGRVREVAESALPFTHYYMFGDRQVAGSHRWVVDTIERIREILKDKTLQNS